MAVSAIANIVKSSLGPVGLDKMLVDDIGVSTEYVQSHALQALFQRLCDMIWLVSREI